MLKKFLYSIFLLLCLSFGTAAAGEPLLVNALITSSAIHFEPAAILENTPFMVHVINQSGLPVELENADTSVEIYAGTDKTFKIGLSAGKYKFFNDFNPQAKTADLEVLTAAQMASTARALLEQSKVTPAPQTIVHSDSLAEIVFIMWRESIEALLVVGIVFSWLKQLKVTRGQSAAVFREGMLFLSAGVGLGVICALLLGWVLIKLSAGFSGNASEYLQAGLTLVAAIMIVYMVKWMRSNGAKLKSEMQHKIGQSATRSWNISILLVVAVAIAREGSEAVIFIYALGFGEHGVIAPGMLGAVISGVVLALLTVYLLSLGNKIFSWRHFFKVTEILLLLLGGALLLNCVDLLVATGVLPVLKAKFWDTSFLLGDGGRFVPLLTSIVGYRATPSLMDVLVYLAYWRSVLWFIRAKSAPLIKV